MRFKFSKEQPNLVDLTRENLKGLKVDISYLNGMTAGEVEELLASAYLVSNNVAFKKVIDYLMSEQVDITVKEAQDWEQVLFGRATINGVKLVEQEIKALSAMYIDKIKKPEDFDKFKGI